MKKSFLVIAIVVAGYIGATQSGLISNENASSVNSISSSDEILAAAFANHRSNFQVQGKGDVVRVLADDNNGNRHQRFIVQLGSGQTLLVAHNIDIANRVAYLESGDHIEFNGEYEWNSKGGVIHWTHHDPQGRHQPGWIKHNDHTYQ